jgi:hypothetical protein
MPELKVDSHAEAAMRAEDLQKAELELENITAQLSGSFAPPLTGIKQRRRGRISQGIQTRVATKALLICAPRNRPRVAARFLRK